MAELPDPIFVFRGLVKGANLAKFSRISGENVVIVGTTEGKIILFDWKSKKRRGCFDGTSSVLSAGVIDGRYVWAQFRNDSIRFFDWNLEPLSDSDPIPSLHCGFCRGVFSPQSGCFAVPTSESGTDLIEVVRLKETCKTSDSGTPKPDSGSSGGCIDNGVVIEYYTRIKPPSCKKLGMIMALQLLNLAVQTERAGSSQSNERILIGFENGSLSSFDLVSGEECWNVSLHSDSIMCFQYNEHTNVAFSGSAGDRIKKWTLNEELKPVLDGEIQLPSPGVNTLSIRPDGKLLLAACWDGICRLYSVKSGRILAAIDYHKASLSCAAFSPNKIEDHWLFAVSSQDESVSVWNLYASQ